MMMIYLGLRSEYIAAKDYVNTLTGLAMAQIKEAQDHPKYYAECKAEFTRLLRLAREYSVAIKEYEARHG